MQLSIVTTLLASTAVHAFSDSSPFVLFSTSKLNTPERYDQLQTSNQVIASAKEILSSCPTRDYVIVSQPNVHAADIRDGSHCKMRSLCDTIASKEIKGRFSVAEVVGDLSTHSLEDYVKEACAAKGKVAGIVKVDLTHLPSLEHKDKRAQILASNDDQLGLMLDTLEGDYTLVMVSDPNEFKAYQPDFIEPVHMDLKRGQFSSQEGSDNGNTTYDNRPLFAKYQFFTPGIFVALLALIVMLSILGVGLKALGSLEVSYGAFDKEMGPTAQKKQQ
ncbi:BIG/ATPase V1 complex, subunit S1 [Neurospora hispaniola]|uniref:Protein BIG1 n=1 Tax=Neurospora hispaniola TaxID=588809 RepID=A0AAJ0MVC3_9PEZI|nr:BIG/ATPase V1 complex, subunit S1 [Neurospora hispaniola]